MEYEELTRAFLGKQKMSTYFRLFFFEIASDEFVYSATNISNLFEWTLMLSKMVLASFFGWAHD